MKAWKSVWSPMKDVQMVLVRLKKKTLLRFDLAVALSKI